MKLTAFERDSIRIILEKEDPQLLEYLPLLSVCSREDNGVGRVIKFAKIRPILEYRKDLTLGKSLYADIDGMACGVGFMLFVDDGVPEVLEVFSHGNEIVPKFIASYEHSYI